MSTKYPNGIDDTITLPVVIDTITPVQADVVNRLRSAIVAIQQELGIDPSREYGTVRARIDAIDGYGGSGGSGGVSDGYIIVQDEGSLVSSQIRTLNFIGADVVALNGAETVANIYIPPPTYVSHWDTSDGTNGSQAVTESITRVSARISTPNGGEGTPFKTGGWAGSAHPATTSSSVVFTTPSETTGFGGTSTIQVIVYDADGVAILDNFTTPVITATGTHTSTSTFITVNITNFAADALRFKAKATITVNVAGLIPNGGKYNVQIIHNTDTSTDGSGPYIYTQPAVFYDKNATTPSINGTFTIAETVGNVVTKHLSGLEYYTLTSQFTVSVTDIDQLNKDTARASGNLNISATEYALATLDHSPFGTGSENFSNWDNNDNTDDVSYSKTDWSITESNYRYVGPTANASAFVRDSWGASATANTTGVKIMVDTYSSSSSATFEDFNSETYRQDSTFNAGNSAGNWDSTASLLSNEAMVFNGKLMPASQTSYIRSDGYEDAYTNWSDFKPDLGGANPNYSSLTAVPANYYRTFTTASTNIVNFTMVLAGTFVGANALADLVSGNLEIFVYKVGGLGNYGPPPANTNALLLHGTPYNNATFDDGATDGHIRTESSTGNTIQATFGGFNASNGIYVHIVINHASIKIDSMSITFN